LKYIKGVFHCAENRDWNLIEIDMEQTRLFQCNRFHCTENR